MEYNCNSCNYGKNRVNYSSSNSYKTNDNYSRKRDKISYQLVSRAS